MWVEAGHTPLPLGVWKFMRYMCGKIHCGTCAQFGFHISPWFGSQQHTRWEILKFTTYTTLQLHLKLLGKTKSGNFSKPSSTFIQKINSHSPLNIHATDIYNNYPLITHWLVTLPFKGYKNGCKLEPQGTEMIWTSIKNCWPTRWPVLNGSTFWGKQRTFINWNIPHSRAI